LKNTTRTDKISFEAYGVRIGVQVSDVRAIEKIKEILPINSRITKNEAQADHDFSLVWGADAAEEDILYRGNEEVARRVDPERLIALLDTCIRMAIGEFAPRHVFIHAGVVGWKGQALIFPAKSYGGKTTLVAELIKNGAVYYSDEYAVIDENGLAHPYPKALSIRKEGEYEQTERPVEELGGQQGTEPIPVGMVFLTEFEPGAEWNPRVLSAGQGLMGLLPHTLALRHNPEFVFKVLNLITKRAIIASSQRGEVSKFAPLILNFTN
jgi:hypothetical protein